MIRDGRGLRLGVEFSWMERGMRYDGRKWLSQFTVRSDCFGFISISKKLFSCYGLTLWGQSCVGALCFTKVISSYLGLIKRNKWNKDAMNVQEIQNDKSTCQIRRCSLEMV